MIELRLMVASDIHGSALYCRKMLSSYEKEGADKLLLLGDLLYHGPRNDLPEEYSPKKVTEMLNGVKNELICVRGNCDTEVDQMVLDFPIMAEYCILWIGNKMIFVTHGHHFGKDSVPNIKKGDVLLCGHTHIPAFESTEDIFYVNPGSVSIPKEKSRHSYLIIENGIFTFKDLDMTEYDRKML